MAATLLDLKAYVGETFTDNDALLDKCLVDSAALINQYLPAVHTVPDSILDRCHIIVAADLFERRNAPNGIANQQYASVDGIGQAPMRIARDPMAGVYKILSRWVTPW